MEPVMWVLGVGKGALFVQQGEVLWYLTKAGPHWYRRDVEDGGSFKFVASDKVPANVQLAARLELG